MSRPVTLVTGASRGIGRALALDLARKGHLVINLSRSPPTGDFPGLNYPVDLGDELGARQVLSEVTAAHPIDNLVNNAGLIRINPLAQIGADDFRAQIDLNLRAAILCAQAVLPAMRARRRGRVVNIASRAMLGKAGRSVYGATKAALIGLTRTWALELAPDGITVNAVSPGPIETELFRANYPADGAAAKAIVAAIPLGRIGTPADVAAAVAFFISDEASFITGQVLHVCGGLSVGGTAI